MHLITQLKKIIAGDGYIRAHWRGELSLPVSFWLNSFLTGIVGFAIVSLINTSIEDSLNPVHILLALVSMFVLLLTIAVWHVAGLWRAAEHHKKKKGRKSWAIAAQIIIVLAVSQLVKPFIDGIEQIIETAKIATETDKASKFAIKLKNNTDLHITGHIAFKMVGALDKYFTKNKELKAVHLTSVGGRIGPALHISNTILAKNLDTHAKLGCHSACTIVFIGGNKRIISVGTKLGFHRGAMPGVSDSEMQAIQTEEKNYFLARGIPDAFLRKVYGTASSQMWYPTYKELMQANVVTHISVGKKKYIPIERYCRTENCGTFSTAPIWLQEIAAGVNLTVPKKIDQITVFERAISGPKKNFTYLYTLLSSQQMNFDRLSQNIGKTTCNNRKMNVLFKNGITMHWKYRDPKGRLLHEVTLSSDDCKKFRPSL